MRANFFMTFRYHGGDLPYSFGSVITQKAFDTFIGSNQPTGTRLSEEDVKFPDYLMGGDTRTALVHYTPDGEKFAAYVPVFATEAEIDTYMKPHGR